MGSDYPRPEEIERIKRALTDLLEHGSGSPEVQRLDEERRARNGAIEVRKVRPAGSRRAVA